MGKAVAFSFSWGERRPTLASVQEGECSWDRSGNGCSVPVLTQPYSLSRGAWRGLLCVSHVQQGRRQDQGVDASQGWVWEVWKIKVCVALCVCTNPCEHIHLSTAQKLACHFSSQTSGLFIKLKAAISIRKYSIPAISPEGWRALLAASLFCSVPKQCFDVQGAPNGS